jgi:hypothetical protein
LEKKGLGEKEVAGEEKRRLDERRDDCDGE